jgi:3-methyladenine DNA glycosylase Tag
MLRGCGWPSSGTMIIGYHDTEWGMPADDDPEKA